MARGSDVSEMFDSLNVNRNLVDFEGNSLREVLDQIAQITLPTKILHMYGMNGKHYAVVLTEAKVRKVARQPKEKILNGNIS